MLNNCPISEILHEDETIEDLQLNGMKLIQKKNAFRFGMDSVLLAHFADIRPKDQVADFGTGNGILPILLKGRNKGKHFYAFDILESAVNLAERNAALNGMKDSMTVIMDDVSRASLYISPGSLDAVICNPPYWRFASAMISPNHDKAVARSQSSDTLDSFLKSSFILLKGRGKLFMVYPASQMLQVMNQLHLVHLEPKRFRLVYPCLSKPANLVLVEAVKDAKPTLHPMPPLIIYNDDGSLTNELKSVYHI